jgi:hypothetical protein
LPDKNTRELDSHSHRVQSNSLKSENNKEKPEAKSFSSQFNPNFENQICKVIPRREKVTNPEETDLSLPKKKKNVKNNTIRNSRESHIYLFLRSKNTNNEHYLCDHGASMASTRKNRVLLMITEDTQEKENVDFQKTNVELGVFHFICFLNYDKFYELGSHLDVQT